MIVHTLVVWFIMLTGITAILTFFESSKIDSDIAIPKGGKRVRSTLIFMSNVLISVILQTLYNLEAVTMVLLGLLYHTIYWVEFDLFLNLMRKDLKKKGLSLFQRATYVSDNGRDDSDVWTDKVFHFFSKKYTFTLFKKGYSFQLVKPTHTGLIQMVFKIVLIILLTLFV